KNDSAAVRQTRSHSGLGEKPVAGSGPAYALNLNLSAPARVFVRGRGLDAELFGEMRLLGTTADVRPDGRFELIRGRFDLLGTRFVLTDGSVQLLGSLVPFIDFSASTDTVDATATVTLSGPATQPELHFTSSTDLPEEEIAAQLLFGKNIGDASAFQLVQLASALATLAGRGGPDIATRIRQRLRLDDLDVTVDDAGDAALTAGKYVTGKAYSQVTVDQNGRSTVEIDLNVNKNLTLKGGVGTDGTSGVGLFYSKDY
ncbi:MAG: translocation/assembly module TamB domain-containing protein, partial [Paracoccaceae bacterium]